MAQAMKFRVGKIYWMNSICDSNCYWYYNVINRTKRTVNIIQVNEDGTQRGKEARFRICQGLSVLRGAESIKPLGTFSMSPTLSADKIHIIEK